MNKIISKEVGEIKGVFDRFKKRDFSGDNGKIIKNSTYQLIQNLVFKFGSLFFTIIIARMLLPEMMGRYNLALATIIIFASFSDLGISFGITTFVSKMLGKKNEGKAKGYTKLLLKWKIYLLIITSIILISTSYFIAEYYYNKPIFYAILMGALYIPVFSLLSFIEQLYYSSENFKRPLIKEIIFQIIRLIIVPLSIMLFLSKGFSSNFIVALTIILTVLSYFFALVYLSFHARKELEFLSSKKQELTQKELLELKKFIYPLSATALMGMFFGYIDIFMLGHYISEEYIAYYSAAFNLVGGIGAILTFIASAALPTFTRKKGFVLERMFSLTKKFTLITSLMAAIFTYFFAHIIIRLIYGSAYQNSSIILQYLAVLIVVVPITTLYLNYYVSQKKTKRVAFLLVLSTVVNVVLNLWFIPLGLVTYGEMGAIIGAIIATIIGRIVYMVGFLFK